LLENTVFGKFLVEVRFSWDEVHDIAEQLEHIQIRKTHQQIDEIWVILQDPHPGQLLNMGKLKIEKRVRIYRNAGICVKDTSSEFLKYLDKQGIALGSKIEIIGKESFDLSLKIVDMGFVHFE
jgi:DtxR family Mn-dependent transcriptional regulator